MWRRAPLRLASIMTIASAAFVVIVVSISERGDRHALILVPTLAVIAGAGIWYGSAPDGGFTSRASSASSESSLLSPTPRNS